MEKKIWSMIELVRRQHKDCEKAWSKASPLIVKYRGIYPTPKKVDTAFASYLKKLNRISRNEQRLMELIRGK